jgi:hypothetical protein
MPQTQKSNQSKTVPPPDSQQIASTNETVNTFLGGRTRSWMTGGSVAVTNPTPGLVASSNSRKRIRKRKASDTDTVLLTRNQNDNAIQRNNVSPDQSLERQPGDEELTRYARYANILNLSYAAEHVFVPSDRTLGASRSIASLVGTCDIATNTADHLPLINPTY